MLNGLYLKLQSARGKGLCSDWFRATLIDCAYFVYNDKEERHLIKTEIYTEMLYPMSNLAAMQWK